MRALRVSSLPSPSAWGRLRPSRPLDAGRDRDWLPGANFGRAGRDLDAQARREQISGRHFSRAGHRRRRSRRRRARVATAAAARTRGRRDVASRREMTRSRSAGGRAPTARRRHRPTERVAHPRRGIGSGVVVDGRHQHVVEPAVPFFDEPGHLPVGRSAARPSRAHARAQRRPTRSTTVATMRRGHAVAGDERAWRPSPTRSDGGGRSVPERCGAQQRAARPSTPYR